MLRWIKNLFRKDDPTAKNCDVYIHIETGELYVINSRGEIEGNLDKVTTQDIVRLHVSPDVDTVIFTLSRLSFQYLGQL